MSYKFYKNKDEEKAIGRLVADAAKQVAKHCKWSPSKSNISNSHYVSDGLQGKTFRISDHIETNCATTSDFSISVGPEGDHFDADFEVDYEEVYSGIVFGQDDDGNFFEKYMDCDAFGRTACGKYKAPAPDFRGVRVKTENLKALAAWAKEKLDQ